MTVNSRSGFAMQWSLRQVVLCESPRVWHFIHLILVAHTHVLLKSLYPSDWNRSISAETNAFHFPPELCLISYKMFLQFHVIYFHCCLQLQVSVDVIISWAEYISLGICSAQLFFSEMPSFFRFVQDEFGEIKMRNWSTRYYFCLWLGFYFYSIYFICI